MPRLFSTGATEVSTSPLEQRTPSLTCRPSSLLRWGGRKKALAATQGTRRPFSLLRGGGHKSPCCHARHRRRPSVSSAVGRTQKALAAVQGTRRRPFFSVCGGDTNTKSPCCCARHSPPSFLLRGEGHKSPCCHASHPPPSFPSPSTKNEKI